MSAVTSTVITATAATKVLKTAPASNGFHLLWSVVDSATDLSIDPSGITLAFSIKLPGGAKLAFDISPVAASEYQIPPSACGPNTEIEVIATGLANTKTVVMLLKNMF